MKKVFSFLLISAVLIASIAAWLLWGSGTGFAEKNKYFIIEKEQTNKANVMAVLENKYVIKNATFFGLAADALDIWSNIKPGKYEVKKGASTIDIIRMLKNGKQAEIKLVINKLRLKEDLAKLIAKNFAIDSTEIMHFLNSNDSLKQFGVDTNTLFTMILPDTYSFYWNTPLQKMLNKLKTTSDNFWLKNNRKDKAASVGLTKEAAYTLASIVEEETNYNDDRAKIASVYLNRININMPLQACPTIKYAMKDFTITRIYEKYLFNSSPYNTYRVKGLPPGPICTPSPKCIDIVLDAPKTNYLYFVAKANFDGYHHFSSNFAEHNAYAKEYQKALDIYMAKKQQP
ncbi:MAG: endolytic transglycosylase MltG [Chitinophagaceae bacterium]|jgi:UPF0755 protein|nr:endolytic transglycosylase MltG [Chitinophagaceae bacterium]